MESSAGTLRAKVLAYLRQQGPSTEGEIATSLAMNSFDRATETDRAYSSWFGPRFPPDQTDIQRETPVVWEAVGDPAPVHEADDPSLLN